MLKLIVSLPGTGKTNHITERIRVDADLTSAPILLVPEQTHFETERMIYKKLGAKCFCNTEILSFTKLGSKIISEYKKEKAPASDAVREITMFKIARELKSELKFYGSVCENPDFAARMLGTVEAFQREGISPEELTASAEEIKNNRLKTKTRDIALIYGRYVCSLGENFSDRPDEIRIAAGLAFKEKYFAGKNIFIDSFDGFTGGQILLLEAMISQASSVTVTLPADNFPTENPDYIIIDRLARKLINCAEKNNIKAVIEKLGGKARNPEENTEIYILPDVYAESNFTAAKIRELITLHNFAQSDIAVLNPPSAQVLSGAFSAYGISEFSDIPEAIIEKPMVKFIITALEAAEGRQGAFLDLIQSGFARVGGRKSRRLCHKHIKLLTRAAFEFQPDEDDWRKPFPKAMLNAEKIRAEITEKIAALKEKTNETTGDKITEALAEFLIRDMEISRTIADIVYRGKKVDSALNDEYRSLWEKVIGVLEAMHGALKNQKISLQNYKSVLASVFGKTMTAKPPQVIDAVTVGDLRRTRAGKVKAVFLMSANRGDFPKNLPSGAEFTENETEQLCSSGIFIDENRTDKYYRDRFLIKRVMTLPTERLYITASLKDEAWKEKQLARIITEQEKRIKSTADLPLSFWVSHETALEFFTAENPREPALTEALRELKPEIYSRIIKSKIKNYKHRINPENAEKLLKKNSISPSGIEKLNTCLFKYFCSSGLRVENAVNPGGAEPDALTRGSMVHYVLERVFKDYSGGNYKEFIEIFPCEFINIAEKYLREFEESEYAGGWARSARKKDILLSHAAGIAEVLKQMREDMEASDFRPFELEKKFEFMLGDILVRGKTDRLDAVEKDGSRYVRVIDYKTGGKHFSYPEIEFGLNMQALIYLIAAVGMSEDIKPSGAFYRLVNGGKLTKTAIPFGAVEAAKNPKYLKKNRAETQGISGMKFTESNDLKTEKKLINLTENEFYRLVENAEKQLRERLSALYAGDVSAVPTYSGNSPCAYCDYKNICGNAGEREEVKI